MSLDGDNKPFNGLLALLRVVNEIEIKSKKEANRGTCGNKLCKERTGKWLRRKINGTYTWLCEKCANAYTRKQYCKHCKQIYKNTKESIRHNCIQCNKPPGHIDSEEKKTKISAYERIKLAGKRKGARHK